MKIRTLALISVFAAVAALVFAQSGNRGKAEATIGGGEVVIDYGRPELKGRTIEELTQNLPEDRIWRAGMNQVTTLETDVALDVGGTEVPPGKYSLYVHIPESGNWSLILNEDLGVPLKEIFNEAPPNLANEPWPYLEGYGEKIGDKEVVRAEMNEESASSPTEQFTIDLTDEGKLTMSWGTERWSLQLRPATS